LWEDTQLITEYTTSVDTSSTVTLSKRYDYVQGSYAPTQVSDGTNDYSVHTDHLQTPKWLTN